MTEVARIEIESNPTVDRAEQVVKEQRAKISNKTALARIGLAGLAFLMTACTEAQVRQPQPPASQVEQVSSPTPSPIATSTPEIRRPLTEQEKAAIAEALPQILANEEAETKKMPSVPERATPLSHEEATKLTQEFALINQAVKNLITPDAINRNPELQYDALLNDPDKLDQYRRAGYFFDVPDAGKRNPDDKSLLFLPQGGKGGIAISVQVTPDGHVYRQEARVMIDENGKVGSQFRKPNLPQDKQSLRGLVEGFYNNPLGAPLKWTSPEDQKRDDSAQNKYPRSSILNEGIGISGNQKFDVAIDNQIGDASAILAEQPVG